MAELPRCSRKLRREWQHLQNSRPGHRASAYQGHTYTAFAIAFLTVLFCSKIMAGPTQKWPALSDITNTGTLIDYTMQKLTSTYMPSSLPTVCKQMLWMRLNVRGYKGTPGRSNVELEWLMNKDKKQIGSNVNIEHEKRRNQAILPTLSKHQVQWQVCKDKVDCRPVTQFIWSIKH